MAKRFCPGQCQRRDYLGKEVRFTPDTVLKHYQKGT